MKIAVLSLILFSLHVAQPKPQRKIIDTCAVVTLKNQVACHKAVLGTFPPNPAWYKGLK